MVAVCLCIYFTYHSLQGDRGVFKFLSLNVQVEKAYSDLAALEVEKAYLQERVVMLRPDSLNMDFLEERARTVLGLKFDGEQILLLN